MRLIKYIAFIFAIATTCNAGIFGGTNGITSIYAGTNQVTAVYAGTNLVWSFGFSPLDIANCELWLDGADASTVTLADTDKVTAWADKSTVGDNAVQIGADTTRPTYCSNQQNGLCTLSFDGTDYLGVDYKSVDGQTVFAVAKVDTTENRFLLGGRDSTNLRSYITTVGGIFDAGVGVQTSTGSTEPWGSGYRYVSFDYSGSQINLCADGVPITSVAQSSTGANTTHGYYIGTFNNAGSPQTSGHIGNIAEVIIYKRVLDTAERQQVEAYLSDKWGL